VDAGDKRGHDGALRHSGARPGLRASARRAPSAPRASILGVAAAPQFSKAATSSRIRRRKLDGKESEPEGRYHPEAAMVSLQAIRPCMPVAVATAALLAAGGATGEPDLIFKRSTVFKLRTPNDKLATYGLDDPEVAGVACYFTVPERGGLKAWIGMTEESSDISLACRQIGAIRFMRKFAQGGEVFRQHRSPFFKKMQIVRGCDAKLNALVYMVYSDPPIAGSAKSSTSTVPVMPWGGSEVQKCADWPE
jgi:CreA protein